jgi:hypothetical protein
VPGLRRREVDAREALRDVPVARDRDRRQGRRRAAEGTPPEHKPISPGQRGKFHAKCDELDALFEEPKGTVKRATLEAASKEFGRRITSVDDLSYSEMSWAIDRLMEILGANELALR